MFNKAICFVCFIIVVSFFYSYSAILPLPTTLPKVSRSYDQVLLKTWQGIKNRNIDPYSVKLVHRPKSEYPNDAVSEGVGYGMLLALYCNDQEYFNKIWLAAEQYMWTGEFYNWRVDESGKVQGTGAATDAEEDIAVALIFADQLVKKNIWTLSNKNASGVTYDARAKTILTSIKKYMIEGSYLRPGSGWGGAAFVNPGYFAPAWYKVFAEYDSTSKVVWTNLIDQCYKTISLSPGYSNGLIPDWLKPDGQYNSTPLGYNPTGDGKWLYKDGIRIYWRLATDYLWYDEPRAKPFLQNAIKFVQDPSRANFYQMDGTNTTGTFKLGNEVERPRTEHSHLTIGMWACASMISGIDTAEQFSDELMKYYDTDADYWGKASDSAGEDTLHNEMYFDQFLAFFGASQISGVFTNIWDDLKDPDPSLPLAWVKTPSLSTSDLNADNGPLKISGEFNKIARWTVLFTNRNNSNESVSFTGSSSKIDISWYGLSESGKAMSQGFYDITIKARGLDKQVVTEVWLGKAMSLFVNNRLIVDDFRDGDLKPFIGNSWTQYLDSYDGKSGASSVKRLVVETSGASKTLIWQYLLNAGSLSFDPYAALELNFMNNSNLFNMTGVDTIIINASAKASIGISFQVVTDDIVKSGTFSYYDDSLYLTTTSKEFKIPISKLKQRFGGTMKLDLTKVTAIRFQVQQKTGSEGEIHINKVQFTGNLSGIYTAPPEYKKMGVLRNGYKQFKYNQLYSVKMHHSNIIINFNTTINGDLQIVNPKGQIVYRSSINSRNYMSIDRSKNSISSGLYLMRIYDQQYGVETVPLKIVR